MEDIRRQGADDTPRDDADSVVLGIARFQLAILGLLWHLRLFRPAHRTDTKYEILLLLARTVWKCGSGQDRSGECVDSQQCGDEGEER